MSPSGSSTGATADRVLAEAAKKYGDDRIANCDNTPQGDATPGEGTVQGECIVSRLRRWAHAVDAVPASDLMDEAADEIDRLREAIRRLADQDATLSVVGGNVIVQIDGP